MDVDAILRRHPGVCIIDGLAYDNPPGSRHTYRWQDVEEILSAGISVMTSLNLQYIEEHRAQVEQITGKKVQSTVPVSFIHEADEIEIVDAPAEMTSGRWNARPPRCGPSASAEAAGVCAKSRCCSPPMWSIGNLRVSSAPGTRRRNGVRRSEFSWV